MEDSLAWLDRPLRPQFPLTWIQTLVLTSTLSSLLLVVVPVSVGASSAEESYDISTGGGGGGGGTGGDTYSYGWDDECPQCDYDCSRCGDDGGGGGGGGGNTNCNAACRCPAISRRNGQQICNCPFADDSGTINPCCYNPPGKIPGACPHPGLFG